MTSGGSWRSQETRASWLDAQELDGAGTGFAELATALGQRRELDGVVAAVSGKQRRKKEEQRRRLSFIGRQKTQGGDTQWPACASAKPRAATGVTGS